VIAFPPCCQHDRARIAACPDVAQIDEQREPGLLQIRSVARGWTWATLQTRGVVAGLMLREATGVSVRRLANTWTGG
jgi:hypothetical protein